MQRRILIIDDHDDLATSLHEVLTHVGHFVHVVVDRNEALAIENIESFDLVITDLDVENLSADTSFKGNASICLPTTLVAGHYGEHIKAFKDRKSVV